MKANLSVKKDAILVSLNENEHVALVRKIRQTIETYAKHDVDIYADLSYSNNILTIEFYYHSLTGRIYVSDYNFLNLLVKTINTKTNE